jgi:hypothetical protein
LTSISKGAIIKTVKREASRGQATPADRGAGKRKTPNKSSKKPLGKAGNPIEKQPRQTGVRECTGCDIRPAAKKIKSFFQIKYSVGEFNALQKG